MGKRSALPRADRLASVPRQTALGGHRPEQAAAIETFTRIVATGTEPPDAPEAV